MDNQALFSYFRLCRATHGPLNIVAKYKTIMCLNSNAKSITHQDIMIRGLVELLDCLNDLVLWCIVLCAWPLDVGIPCVFCALFCLPNVGQGYNNIKLCGINVVIMIWIVGML